MFFVHQGGLKKKKNFTSTRNSDIFENYQRKASGPKIASEFKDRKLKGNQRKLSWLSAL